MDNSTTAKRLKTLREHRRYWQRVAAKARADRRWADATTAQDRAVAAARAIAELTREEPQ